MTQQHLASTHIAGSARSYQELSAPLAIPATAEQAGGQAVCLCVASAGRECAVLPHVGWSGGRLSRLCLVGWCCGGGSSPERSCRQGCEPGEAGDDAGALEQAAEAGESG